MRPNTMKRVIMAAVLGAALTITALTAKTLPALNTAPLALKAPPFTAPLALKAPPLT